MLYVSIKGQQMKFEKKLVEILEFFIGIGIVIIL
jgi:hypothetical protein